MRFKHIHFICFILFILFFLGNANLMQVVVSNQRVHKAASNMLTSAQVQLSKLKVPSPEATITLNDYGKLPLVFEANQSQTDNQVEFLSRGRGYNMYFTPNEAVLVLKKTSKIQGKKSDGKKAFSVLQNSRDITYNVLRMELIGANPFLKIKGAGKLPGRSNYLIGNNPEKWLTNIPNYLKVIYREVYPGINLVFYGNQQQLEYDFIVEPGAHPDDIQFTFKGADKLHLDEEGNLILQMAGDKVIQRAPIVYQEIGGNKREIAGSYVLNGKDMVGFQVAAYDPTKPLIIDPILVYSTFLGGSGGEGGWDIALDASGNVYVTGRTDLTNFPLTNPLQSTPGSIVYGGSDAFVTKLDLTNTVPVYSTFIGGSSFEISKGIAVDASGNAYITGETWSTNFPVKNPFQAVHGGISDAFVVKLNPSGSEIVYSTYLGGGGYEQGAGIATDTSGNAYITGATSSSNFPTLNPYQADLGGATDAFVSKLDSTGSALVYSTYLGGRNYDNFDPSVFSSTFAVTGDITVDVLGNAYVTGNTCSPDFPTLNPYQADFAGEIDAIVAKLTSTGTLLYSTYLGGIGADKSAGISADLSGNVYITGGTNSPDFPTLNPYQADLGGVTDAFVSKLDSTGSALVYSTYLGGHSVENYTGMSVLPFSVLGDIAVDNSGSVYVTGFTASPGFPILNSYQADIAGAIDAFVTKLNPEGTDLVYSTFFGGISVEVGIGIAVDDFGSAYVSGATASPNFPTKNPMQPFYGGGTDDAFVIKIEN